MNILYITNMFPTPSNPVSGIFVKEQIQDVAGLFDCQYEVHLIDGIHKGKSEYLKSIFEVPRKVRKGNYDIIHIHYGLSGLFLLFFKPKSKVFLTLHGSDILREGGNKWQVFLTKRILSKVDKVFILNGKMEKIVKRRNANFENLPCGVNTDFFKPLKDWPAKNSNEKLIVFPNSPARIVKNYPLFEKTIRYLNEQFPMGFEFRCIENLSREGVRDLLSEADCLLMTSKSEGSPQVVKEALSCGTPVVTVPVGDVREMLKEVPHCFVADSMNDPKELGQLVLKAIKGKTDGLRIRKAFIEKGKYDHESVAQRLIANYEQPKWEESIATVS